MCINEQPRDGVSVPRTEASVTDNVKLNTLLAPPEHSVIDADADEDTTPTLPPSAKRIIIALWIGLIGYMIYTNQNFNFFLLAQRIVLMVITPFVSLRDGNNRLTSVEYNVQTRVVVGLICYSLALMILNYDTFMSFLGTKSKEYYSLAVMAAFIQFDTSFIDCYCIPSNDLRSSKNLWFIVEDGMSLPLTLISMFALQDIKHTILTSMFVRFVFLYKIGRLAFDWKTVATMKTATLRKQNQATISLADSLDTKSISRPNIWYIYGNAYDLTSYVQSHPGGKEAILLGANRDDCTALFQSYHAFNISKAKAVLNKYQVSSTSGSTSKMDTIVNSTTSKTKEITIMHENDVFYNILAERVERKLKENHIDPVIDRAATYKRHLFYTLSLLAVLWSFRWHLKGSIVGSIVFGVFGAYMGAWIGHDGGHYAISRIPIINDIGVWCISLICNPIMWQHQHTYGHHSFTNVHEKDPDLHHFHISIRYHKNDPFRSLYKNQKNILYICFSFLFTTVGLCHWYVHRFIVERSLHGAVGWSDRHRILRTIGLLFHYIFYNTVVTVWPFFVMESAWAAFWAGLLCQVTTGFMFALFSQVGHINECAIDTNIAKERRHPIAKVSWAADQVETTCDFCPQSLFWFYVAGQLSLQIEHHLFPSLNHCHLQLIQPIVEETCKEYNVDYKKYDSYQDIFNETIKYIKSLSTEVLDSHEKVD